MFVKLEGRRCLVVGAGKVGEPKIASLIESGARVRVVALEAGVKVHEWARAGKITLELRAFAPDDLDEIFVSVVATASRTLNESVYREANRRGILCNVVDVPEYCDFYYPAIVRRGDLQIAISTNGQSPSLAKRIRQELERQFGPEYTSWVAELGAKRKLVLTGELDPESKREVLYAQASSALSNAKTSVELPPQTSREGRNGRVYLVGAGPGDPDLLTVKALRLLQQADVVLHDDLVSPEILKLISPTAQVRNVGKRCGTKAMRQEEINFLLVNLAGSGLQVVRLKSGDPLIFGRAGEEIEALREAGIKYEIVPGVTSALGAAAAAGIPLTHRRVASTLVLTAGHRASVNEDADWSQHVQSGSTFAIYMPGHSYRETAAKLIRSGFAPETPCAIISRASTLEQQVHKTTISHLREESNLPAPSILIVGDVVKFAEHPQELREQFPITEQFEETLAISSEQSTAQKELSA
jgi:uroporphyrin-III C-methyltransferase / precorrin-2 dehydrogenase / sirohydrochlorin ferrochelatase